MKSKTSSRIAVHLVCCLLIVLQGCSSTIYHFDAAQYFKSKNYNKEMPFTMRGGNISAPLFVEKEQGKINVANIPKYSNIKSTHLFKHNKFNISGALAFGGGDFRIAYSPAKKIMLTANFSSISKSTTEDGNIAVPVTTYSSHWEPAPFSWLGQYVSDTTEGYQNVAYEKTLTLQQNQEEFAIGYYSSFSTHGIYEAIAGWALGSAENRYKYSVKENNSYTAVFSESRNYYQVFLQNNLGYSTKVTEGALCARLTYQRFTSQDFKTDYEIPKYEKENVNLLLEPSFHFGAGSKKLRGFLEYGFAIPLGSTDVDWGGTFRLGASFQF